jgi:DNA-binding response OmpR family regulator
MDRLRILVVEDSHEAADSMALLLEWWGHQPIVVYEGKKAIEIAKTLCPDAVILELV